MSPALEGGFLTTVPPGKSQVLFKLILMIDLRLIVVVRLYIEEMISITLPRHVLIVAEVSGKVLS